MAVQLEIKEQLAKLLATEDIVVEHKQVSSAQFNVHTRVLVLPLWEKASNAVYDMLVGHEVGHALFTPDEDPPEDVPHQFVNVVEDARIEKLMKRKYMGLAKSFYKGYKELYDDDFFELDGEDITTFNLADRANLYFKVGNFLNLAFLPAEKEIIDMISRCETFEDTLKAAYVLYQYCLEPEKEEIESKFIEPDSGEGETFGDQFFDEGSEKGETYEETPTQTGEEEPEVKTAEALDSKLQDLVNDGGVENIYLEVPKVNLDTVIVSNSDVHENIDKHFKFQSQQSEKNCFKEPDSEFLKFKKESQKEVNYLVKEFECRKAASSYSRSATSRTGILNTEKLSSYRFNEDLFKRVTVLPDGKNHGLVFILDWSGSMQYLMKDTCKQLFNLIWFCKKVQIPFEVYAFTNEWRRGDEHWTYKKYYEEKEYAFQIDDNFSLMNILTSKVSGKELDKQLKNIWRTISSFYGANQFTYPRRLSLSGTPLNETLICLHKILPQFQKENGVEKVQCIVLTDGEANSIPYHVMVERSWEDEPRMGCRSVNGHSCSLRDRKLGKTYNFGHAWYEFTDTLIRNLKDRFPDTNFIGIRVLSKRDGKHFIERYHRWDDKHYEAILKDWRKLKTFTIKNSGYDAYFGMCSDSLSDDAEFDVDDSATKAQIKRAFVKSLKVKKLNKKVLGEFVSLVV